MAWRGCVSCGGGSGTETWVSWSYCNRIHDDSSTRHLTSLARHAALPIAVYSCAQSSFFYDTCSRPDCASWHLSAFSNYCALLGCSPPDYSDLGNCWPLPLDTMADFERTVLDFYQLSSPYPSEWPADKDEEEAAAVDNATFSHNQRASRYQALASAVNERRSLGTGPGGVNNLVQKDEPDPLGSSDSVVRSLKNMGLPIQDDIRLRTLTTFWRPSHLPLAT